MVDKQTTDSSDTLDAFRAAKDQFFKTNSQSPLTREQKKLFKGLNYFPENPALRFDATIEVFSDPQEIEMQTSSGDVRIYQRYGQFHFEVEGQEVVLTIYADEGGFFLPFVDSLAGKETYGAGRYLEPQALSANQFQIDFNLAYNPYCAYNDQWSCPLTPFENRIKAPIRAGEKNFHTFI